MMKLMEKAAGTGLLLLGAETPQKVSYQITRYQGIADSGLPVPGLYRIEGKLQLDQPERYIDVPLRLQLEDGRSLSITVVDSSGRVLSEGHGPLKCMCC